MAAVKVSVSMDEQQLRWVRSLAKKRKTTVSALVGEAVAEWRRVRALDHLIDELGGRLDMTDEEIAEIRAEWQD